MSWVREAISDEKGLVDIAYVSIGMLMLLLVVSILFLCTMSAVSYANCIVITDVGQGVRAAVPCTYDPQPIGLAIAASLGAFGSPIAALAAYMAATRRNNQPKTP